VPKGEVGADVLIVGARVAGAVVASYLGDAGVDVLLIDSDPAPGPTLSTHFFRGAGLVGVLDDLGILDEVLTSGAPRLTRQYFHVADSQPMEQPPQEPGSVGFALSVRRETLDPLLVKRARRNESVRYWSSARAKDVVWAGDRVVGARVVRDGEEVSVMARVVVAADGRRSSIARSVGAGRVREDPPKRAMYYGYVSGFTPLSSGPLDAPEFSLLGDELAYVFPSDHGLACVAVSVNLDTFAAMRSRYRDAYRERVLAHPGLRRRIEVATSYGDVLGYGPQPGHVREPAGNGWVLVGDAGIYYDPWSGFGMDSAAVHARFAADAIKALLAGGDQDDCWSRYRRARDDHALGKYQTTVELASDLRRLLA